MDIVCAVDRYKSDNYIISIIRCVTPMGNIAVLIVV